MLGEIALTQCFGAYRLRVLLRAGAAVVCVAMAPVTSTAQGLVDLEKLKRSMDALIKRGQPNPPAQPPAPGSSPQPPSQQPMPAVSLDPDPRFGERSIGGMSGQAVDLDTDQVPHVGGQRAFEAFKRLFGKDTHFLARLYGAGVAPATPAQITFKQEMDLVFAEIRSFDRSVQAEVLGRMIREIKSVHNDVQYNEAGVLGGVQAILREFPLSKNIAVKYKNRPINGQGQFNLEIRAAEVAQTPSRSVREYLSEPTIYMDTELTALASSKDNLLGTFRQAARAGQSGAAVQVGN